MTVRRSLALVAVAALVATAGCGFILGNESLAVEAGAATVNGDALEETGYEETSVAPQTVSRNFSVADQRRTVEVTNQVATYERNVDLGPLGSKRAAVFVALASPEVSVLGQQFNPLAEMSTRQLVDTFESNYEGLSVGDRTDTSDVSVLGESTRMDTYDGSATLSGTAVDVDILVTESVSHDGDHVVTLAVYPRQVDQREAIDTLRDGLEHGG